MRLFSQGSDRELDEVVVQLGHEWERICISFALPGIFVCALQSRHDRTPSSLVCEIVFGRGFKRIILRSPIVLLNRTRVAIDVMFLTPAQTA